MRTVLTWLMIAFVLVLIWGAPKLRAKHPAVWWLLVGYPRAVIRAVFGWRRLSTACELAVPRRPAMALLSGIILRGQALRPVPPRLGFPRPLPKGATVGMTVSIRMHPGQVPDDYLAATEAIAHAWRMHTVRLASPERGRVRLTCLPVDPLATTDVAEPSANPGELLRVTVGRRDDGEPWVVDMRVVPHWLVVGATQSGKSNWISALVVGLAPQPVALVGIDCKGGMELSLYEPRLSALATDRPGAVRLLAALVDLVNERMATCRVHAVRSVWDLPDTVRPVPVVLIVDEVAELFLAATSEEKK
jgi:S-DNA-T family DNA segregation ATPase FtsK/SpoIIIE